MSAPAPRSPAERCRAQIAAILGAWGMAAAPAAATAEIMTWTDLCGIDSHGISLLPFYDMIRRKGQLDLRASPRLQRDNGPTALIDARCGLGHPAALQAMQLALGKAAAHGIGAVGVCNSHHFGAAGYYAALAPERGMIGLVTSSARTVAVVPTFAAEPVLGTNPIAFAAPGGRNPPILLDMATSVVAANKVRVYAGKGEPIPPGWVVDGEGRAVTDSAEALRYAMERPEGGLNPIGGTREMGSHKGYGLALMAQILAATLTGGSFSPSRPPAAPDNIGHFFLALDPAAFRPLADFTADLDAVVDTLHAARPADPERKVLVAGDPERAAHAERSANGIPLPEALRRQIRDIAEAAGVAYLLAEQ
ncbi:MAG TPA: Ldh family oxidoreductase [Stellaceae bacterium]|nr:Ldh family oxidoreductase [Stellaceae bacterium]